MRILGIPVPFTGKALVPGEEKALSTVDPGQGWRRILESYSGAWQQNVVVDRDTAVTYFAVYACMTLIANDIGKLRIKLMRGGFGTPKEEVEHPAFSPVLRKPNQVQTRNQFWEYWLLSKLSNGNTYAVKERDQRGVVTALHVLDPTNVRTLVSDDGAVFYQLDTEALSGVSGQVTVPAREIIHDRMNPIFHKLVGTSPITAGGVAAMQGVAIQNNSANFFGNASKPGGILTAPGAISNDTATRLKEEWETNFSGENAGKVAVVGDGLKFEPMATTAADAQLIEQLQWTADVVCSVFHVPPYKIGIGDMPAYNNVQALNLEYYSQALQAHIEAIETLLAEALGLPRNMEIEFDLDGLLRMDSQTQIETLKTGVGAGIVAPNEARARIHLPPVDGGASPYLQQQNYSLEALAQRDAGDPFATTPAAPIDEVENEGETEGEQLAKAYRERLAA